MLVYAFVVVFTLLMNSACCDFLVLFVAHNQLLQDVMTMLQDEEAGTLLLMGQ